MIYRLCGQLLPEDRPVELWVVDGRITFAPQPVATTLVTTGYILPGLVDAHAHVGLANNAAASRDATAANAWTDLVSGVTLIREPGTPDDTHWLDGSPACPRIIRAGRHIARPRRYIKGFAVEVEPDQLVEQTRREARAGDGWVKWVGDWIDRSTGDLEPLWPVDKATAAVRAAHDEGARVMAHCFGEASVCQLVAAGIDSAEHGYGLDDATIGLMADQGTALVPTLDNVRILPGIAARAEASYPTFATHLRRLADGAVDTIGRAYAAGVPIYAGTDAGGTRAHGTLLGELQALAGIGGNDFALGAASWRARAWLGQPGLVEGAPADLIVARRDPRRDLTSLADLSVIMLAGRLITPDGAD